MVTKSVEEMGKLYPDDLGEKVTYIAPPGGGGCGHGATPLSITTFSIMTLSMKINKR